MLALARFYDRVIAACGAVAAFCVVFVAIGISIDVAIRNTGFGVISWMLEGTEYALFVSTFLGAPWVLRLGAHVRVDVLVAGLAPRARLAMELFADAIGLAVSAVLFYYAVRVGATAYGDGARMIKELIFPEWYIFAVIAVAALLLCIEFVRRIAIVLRRPESAGAAAAKVGL